jgi:calcineurin-like phosphoesterase family protein
MKKIQALSFFSIILTLLVFDSCQQNKLPKLEEITGNMPSWIDTPPPEDTLWGIGVGDLSTMSASCEQAKFNAQLNICEQLSVHTRFVENSPDNFSEIDIITRLNLYQNEFYSLLSTGASQQASFELSEFIKVDRRTKTADGKIWYLVSFPRKEAENIIDIISQYQENYFDSYIEMLEPASIEELDLKKSDFKEFKLASDVDIQLDFKEFKPASDVDIQRMNELLEKALQLEE